MKRILLSLLTLAALASCSKEPAPTPAAGDGIIRVVAGVAATRAVADASTGLTGASFIVVEGGATAPVSFAGGTAYTGDVAAASGEVTFTSANVPAYNLDDANAWFAAYAPGGALAGDAIEWPIDGRTDIMVTDAVWNAGKRSAPVSTGLNFNHRLSQVEVVCRAESGAATSAVRSVWGEITKIEFVGAPVTMKYDLSATPAVSVSGSADFALLADYDGTAFTPLAIPEDDNTTVCAVAMLAPVAVAGAESFRLKVTTSGAAAATPVPITVEIPVSLGGSAEPMTAGRKHTVTLSFKAEEKLIGVAATAVEEWSAGGTGSGEIEFPTPPRVGYYYYADGSTSKTLKSGKTAEGIVFWVDKDEPWHFKVVSKGESGSKAWGPEPSDFSAADYAGIRIANPDTDLAALGRQNGRTNRQIVGRWIDNNAGKTISDFPAFGYCDDMGEGWYLPAENELQQVWCAWNGIEPTVWFGETAPAGNASARTAFDALLTTAGGSAFKATRTDRYWSSTEGHDQYALLMYFETGKSISDRKHYDYPVRCIREILPPPSLRDYYYSDGSTSTELDAGKTVEGIVFWVDPANSTHFKVVGMQETTPIPWCLSVPYDVGVGDYAAIRDGAKDVDAPARRSGKANREILGRWLADAAVNTTNATIADFPAFEYCDGKGEGWYLPAVNEWQYLICTICNIEPKTWAFGNISTDYRNYISSDVLDEFNKLFTNAGGQAMTGYFYWSATEFDPTYSYFFYVLDAELDYSTISKESYHSMFYARCIKDVGN